MTNVHMQHFAEWLADDSDENYDIADLVSDLAELVGIIIDDKKPTPLKTTAPASKELVGATVGSGAAVGAGVFTVEEDLAAEFAAQLPDKKDKIKQPNFFDKAKEELDELIDDNFGINEDTQPIEIFDKLIDYLTLDD